MTAEQKTQALLYALSSLHDRDARLIALADLWGIAIPRTFGRRVNCRRLIRSLSLYVYCLEI